MKKIRFLALFACLTMALAPSAGALEYSIDAPEGANYGKPTSIEVPQTADGGARKNEDISKNAAKIPPLFGSGASNTLNTGSWLTPNLVPGMQPSGGTINGSNAAIVLPQSAGGGGIGSTGSSGSIGGSTISNGTTSSGSNSTTTGPNFITNTQPNTSSGFTKVTSDMYYSNGHLGTRTYKVISVSKVDEDDRSGLAVTRENKLTLCTCIEDERDYRWCVVCTEIV